MDKKRLGETFRDLRMNRRIPLKQVANQELSVSQLSRFERGESELSISKFLTALKHIHVEIKEFMDVASGYRHTEQIRFMSRLIDLEYKRDIDGFYRMQQEELEKYKQEPYKMRYKLNSILLQGFICKCDERIPFPKKDLTVVTDYLFITEQWNIFELALIGNLYLFIDIPILHRMGQEILKRRDYYKEIATHHYIVTITLLNIWETCLHRNALDIADFYQQKIAELIKNETKLYEKTIFLFLKGMQDYKTGQILTGIEQMRQAIQIFNWLGCPHMVKNYSNDFEKVITK